MELCETTVCFLFFSLEKKSLSLAAAEFVVFVLNRPQYYSDNYLGSLFSLFKKHLNFVLVVIYLPLEAKKLL
jgi:hypothetical protein